MVAYIHLVEYRFTPPFLRSVYPIIIDDTAVRLKKSGDTTTWLLGKASSQGRRLSMIVRQLLLERSMHHILPHLVSPRLLHSNRANGISINSDNINPMLKIYPASPIPKSIKAFPNQLNHDDDILKCSVKNRLIYVEIGKSA